MITNELVDFVRTQVAANIPKEQIAAILKPGGWTDADLAEAYLALQVVDTPLVPKPPVFEHPIAETNKVVMPPAGISPAQPSGHFSMVAGSADPMLQPQSESKPQTQIPSLTTQTQPQSQPKPQIQPQSAFRIQTMPVSAAGRKSKLPIIIILVLILLVVAGATAWYFLIFKKAPVTSPVSVDNTSSQTKGNTEAVNPVPVVSSDADLIKTWTKVPDEQNSAAAISAAGKMLSKEDADFLSKYFGKGYDVNNLPTVASANAVGARTVGALAAFMKASTTPFYQCSVEMMELTPEQCNYQYVRRVGQLTLLRSYVLERAGKTPEALSVANSLVGFGQKVTALAEDPVAISIGWTLQKDGYQRIALLNSKLSVPFQISTEEKTGRVNNLREEHKNIFKFLYTTGSEWLEYLADKNKVPSFPQSEENIITADEYRKTIVWNAFDLKKTKKYLYDSYKTEISNVDLACGSPMAPAPYDFSNEVNVATSTDSKSSIENYAGKLMYLTIYASFDSLNAKRCEVEDLINKL